MYAGTPCPKLPRSHSRNIPDSRLDDVSLSLIWRDDVSSEQSRAKWHRGSTTCPGRFSMVTGPPSHSYLITGSVREQPKWKVRMSNDTPLRTLDLNALIAEIGDLLRRVAGDKLIIQRISLDPHLSRIQADPALINWAFVSLATNALGAMLAGSELAVATTNVTLDRDGAGNWAFSPARTRKWSSL